LLPYASEVDTVDTKATDTTDHEDDTSTPAPSGVSEVEGTTATPADNPHGCKFTLTEVDHPSALDGEFQAVRAEGTATTSMCPGKIFNWAMRFAITLEEVTDKSPYLSVWHIRGELSV
jgi:hypothetical protein